MPKINKLITYTTNKTGTSLSESNLSYLLNGEAKPTYFLSEKQIKQIKSSKMNVNIPRAKFICSFQQRLKFFEES